MLLFSYIASMNSYNHDDYITKKQLEVPQNIAINIYTRDEVPIFLYLKQKNDNYNGTCMDIQIR
jgi:hypothetical protein